MISKNRIMPEERAVEIVKNNKFGVLSTSNSSGIPYGVPLNYIYVEEDNALYFHCLKTGRKIDNLKENNNISFVIVDNEEIIEDRFITHYESVMLEGNVEFITEDNDKREKINMICNVLTPTSIERREEVIEKYLPALLIIKINILKITGKLNNDY